MELWIGALNFGFLYAFMTMGVFVTFRIFDFPDVTVDGSFVSGAAVSAILIVAGFNPLLALPASFLVSAAAGWLTAVIHTRLNLHGLLAGILVMTGLYSINLHIMERSNIPLLNQTTLFTYLAKLNPNLPSEIWLCLALTCIMLFFWLALSIFFTTDLGIRMRATGSNPHMASATGVNVNRMKMFGVAFANGLAGVSGALVAQYQGFADIGMGIGTVVTGLAAVIMGETLLGLRSVYAKTASVILGSVVFRLMIAFALFIGMNPIDLKLLTASFVLVTLVASRVLAGARKPGNGRKRYAWDASSRRRLGYAVGVVVLTVMAGFGGKWMLSRTATVPDGTVKVGVVQMTDHAMLNTTRDSFVKEMEHLGYRRNENLILYLENANGDLPTVNTILDKFRHDRVDVIVPISTAATQAAINKVKDRPIVFATVANPFIIGAGASDTDHLPTVTGVYGWVPMDKMLEIVQRIVPGKILAGCIWDSAHANSEFNVANLRKAIDASDNVGFVGSTVTSSSEVYQAALSLVQKGVNVFILAPDNIVYSSFESVVNAARTKHIPIFVSDVERLGDGALGAVGYDYAISGIQAARLVERILKGENPKDIPFERYRKMTFGLNQEAADQAGISLPSDLVREATTLYRGKGDAGARSQRLALFLFNDQMIARRIADYVVDELKRSGAVERHHLVIDVKSAQNEFPMAQAIAQDIVRQRYDFIITLSTPALQVTAQANKDIPHIFGFVTDPYRMGVARSSREHLPQLTGVATLQPVEKTIEAMRELFPAARRIGIVWNPAEACSEACTFKAREAVGKYGFELVEATVSSTNEVVDALRSVLNRDIDLFLTSGDNTVIMALETLARILREKRIPYFTNVPEDVEFGAFVSIGMDYDESARETARIAMRVMDGEKPMDIPIVDFAPVKMHVNLALAQEYGIEMPAAFLKRAAYIKR
jgi:putative tryptophan/tyrosine transport system permease protein